MDLLDHENYIKQLLEAVGENPNRESLQKTPKRFLKAIKFLTSGYQTNIQEIVNAALFEGNFDEMVVVRNIEFFSLCEHHLLPFYGKCHVGYIPDGKIVGLSKIPRIVDAFARRLQVQEKLTTEVAQSLQEHLKPSGVGVVMEAYHMCMMMRGVEKQNCLTITSSMQGCFRKIETRQEFMSLIHRGMQN